MVRVATRTVGDRAERFAERYLASKGLRLIARNFRCRMGEIDLVMYEGACIVFVEVRFRSANRFTSARFTVDARKRRKLVQTAAMFLASDARYSNSVTRFDIVGVDANADGSGDVHWLRDAFRPFDSSL